MLSQRFGPRDSLSAFSSKHSIPKVDIFRLLNKTSTERREAGRPLLGHCKNSPHSGDQNNQETLQENHFATFVS